MTNTNYMEDPNGTNEFRLPMPIRMDPNDPPIGPFIEKRTDRSILNRRDTNSNRESARKVKNSKNPPETDDSKKESSSIGAWVRVPSAPPVPESINSIWHYTDAGGVIGILQSGTLRATSINMLNDSAEYRHGREALNQVLDLTMKSKLVHPHQKRLIEEVVRLSDDILDSSGLYVACASMAADSLAQWRAYGGSTGHALLLNPSRDLTVVSPCPPDRWTSITPRWGQVLYKRDEQMALIGDSLGFIAHGTPTDGSDLNDLEMYEYAINLIELVSYCKDPSFSEEQEIRTVIQAPNQEAIKFRTTALGVTPFIELSIATEPDQRTTEKAHGIPLTGVAVGPFSGRNFSAQGITSLLQSMSYDNQNVSVSTSTLR